MPPRFGSVRGRGLCGLAAVVLSTLLAAALQAEAPKSEETLPLGEARERPIKADEAHVWKVTVAPGTTLLVTVDQHSITLGAEILGARGGDPVEVGSGDDSWGPVVLLLETAGEHRIEVRSTDKSAWPGKYTIRSEALQASPAASPRRDALVLMSRAGREVVPATPDSREKAMTIYRQALGAWRELSERTWEAETLTCLAVLEDESSDLKAATTDFLAALVIWRELRNPQREAEALNWLGVIYKDTQGTAKARESWDSAITLWHGLGERSEEARTRGNLCFLDRQAGSLPEALSCYQENLVFFRETGDASQEAEILNNIGGVHDSQGEPDAALASYEQALALWQTLGNRDKEATVLNNIGALHRTLGEWQEALSFYDRSREILGPLNDSDLAGSVLSNTGYLYNSLGEPRRALGYLEDGLKIHRKVGNTRAEIATLNNLGAAWRNLGDTDKALDQHRQALAKAIALKDAGQQATSRLRLAEVHLDQGDPSAALRELEAALLLLPEKGVRRTRTQALHLQGRALTLAGRAREALPVLQEALIQRRELRDRAGEADTLDAMALAERSLGLTAESLSHAEAAVGFVEELRNGFLSASDRASFLATRRRSFSLLIDLLMARHAADPGKSHDREAFKISERARARSLLDVLRAGHTGSVAPPELLAHRSALLHRLSVQVDRRWKESGARAVALEKEIDGILTEVEAVEAEIRRNDPRFAAFSAPQPVAPEEISGWLEPGTMLLEYSLGEDRSFLWAIEAGWLRSFVLPPQAQIESLARRVYEEVSTAESGSAHRGEAAKALSRILLGPIWNDRSGGSKTAPLHRLVVVPDGALAILPFAALPVPDPGRSWQAPGTLLPLLERMEVVSIPSATTLAVQRQQLKGRVAAPKLAAVFADPVFAADDPRLPRHAGTRPSSALIFERLPASRREAQAIAGLVPAGTVRLELDFAANRDAVLAGDLRDYRVLHFATHALANTQNPELSGLMLSRVDAKGDPREGFLGLSDIYELNLDTDLVVLPGCQTALGKEVRGEGLMGLTRGFQYAGVPRVVATLWRVQDRATAELMTRFYRAMWRDRLSPAAALRQAQRSLRREPGYRAPYSWAGFILQGDWQ